MGTAWYRPGLRGRFLLGLVFLLGSGLQVVGPAATAQGVPTTKGAKSKPQVPEIIELWLERVPGDIWVRPSCPEYSWDRSNCNGGCIGLFPRSGRRGRILEAEIYYPFPDEGALVPVYGHIYRFTTQDKRIIGPAAFCLVPEKELPPGVAVQPDSFIVPLRKNTNIRAQTRLYNVKAYREAVRLDRPYDAGVTTITVLWIASGEEGEVRAGLLVDSNDRKVGQGVVVVRRGEVLGLGELGHRVRNIVPANARTQVIGWVELEGEPLELGSSSRGVRVLRLESKPGTGSQK
jgi:hypothetical protein